MCSGGDWNESMPATLTFSVEVQQIEECSNFQPVAMQRSGSKCGTGVTYTSQKKE